MTILELFLEQMTEKQGRRFRLHLRGWSSDQIAKQEGVTARAVRESLHTGEKRAKKRLKFLEKTFQKPSHGSLVRRGEV